MKAPTIEAGLVLITVDFGGKYMGELGWSDPELVPQMFTACWETYLELSEDFLEGEDWLWLNVGWGNWLLRAILIVTVLFFLFHSVLLLFSFIILFIFIYFSFYASICNIYLILFYFLLYFFLYGSFPYFHFFCFYHLFELYSVIFHFYIFFCFVFCCCFLSFISSDFIFFSFY